MTHDRHEPYSKFRQVILIVGRALSTLEDADFRTTDTAVAMCNVAAASQNAYSKLAFGQFGVS